MQKELKNFKYCLDFWCGINFKLFMASKTKELAKSNSHQCFDF